LSSNLAKLFDFVCEIIVVVDIDALQLHSCVCFTEKYSSFLKCKTKYMKVCRAESKKEKGHTKDIKGNEK